MHAAPVYVDMLDPLADEAHVYIEHGWQQRLEQSHPMHSLAADPLNRALVRSVSSARWWLLQTRSLVFAVRRAEGTTRQAVPTAVVVLDLCVSPHPREQRVARHHHQELAVCATTEREYRSVRNRSESTSITIACS